MTELKRTLGFGTILFLAIASIMGSGLFFGVGIGASHAGSASLISWVILALLAVYISTFFGELVAMFPKAGGVYEFSKHTYGRFFSFMMGWLVWLVGNLSTAVLIVAAMNSILPDPSQELLKIIISIGLILTLNIIAFFGVEISGLIVSILAVLSIGVLLAVIFPGFFLIESNNLFPLFNESFVMLPILIAVFFLAESFFGWEATTFLAEETKNPEKVIPKALVIGTVVVGLLAVSVAFVSLGMVPFDALAKSSAPLSIVFGKIYGSFGAILNFGVFLSLIGAAAGGIVTMPRLILALARDKLFISQFADIHPRFKTPHKAIIFQTIISLIVFGMAFGNYITLLSLLIPLGLILYIFTILTIPILRWKFPDMKRNFKAPFAKIGSFLVVLFLASLVVIWITQEPNAIQILLLGISFVVTGIPIYLLLQMYHDPDVIVKTNDQLAYFTLLTEKFILPKKVMKEILMLLGNVRGKKVLEFGCSVGTLTVHLAEKVKPKGNVYATDLSKRDLVITKKRMKKKGHEHVIVIHDEDQVSRVHPDVPKVDAIVSIGMMGYLQDVKKVLKEMHNLLPNEGKIVFVDYADFFKVIPNVEWLSEDSTIEKIFRDSGFSVLVTRKKGILWNYIYVYGHKIRRHK